MKRYVFQLSFLLVLAVYLLSQAGVLSQNMVNAAAFFMWLYVAVTLVVCFYALAMDEEDMRDIIRKGKPIPDIMMSATHVLYLFGAGMAAYYGDFILAVALLVVMVGSMLMRGRTDALRGDGS